MKTLNYKELRKKKIIYEKRMIWVKLEEESLDSIKNVIRKKRKKVS